MVPIFLYILTILLFTPLADEAAWLFGRDPSSLGCNNERIGGKFLTAMGGGGGHI